MPETTDSRRVAIRGCGGCVDRRTVLRGAALVGVAGPLLAACGGDDGTATGNGTEPRSAPTTEGSSPSASEAPSGNGDGEVLTSTGDIPVGGGQIFDEQQVVVTQPEAGTFMAFTAVCTHQGCIVSSVENGTISCGCHGSQYDAATGEVTGGPAPQPLAEKPITVEGDQILLG